MDIFLSLSAAARAASEYIVPPESPGAGPWHLKQRGQRAGILSLAARAQGHLHFQLHEVQAWLLAQLIKQVRYGRPLLKCRVDNDAKSLPVEDVHKGHDLLLPGAVAVVITPETPLPRRDAMRPATCEVASDWR